MAAEKRASKDKVTPKVVVIFENDRARNDAVRFSDSLVERFWSKYDFEIGWWSYESLAEPQGARHAAEAVREADLVIFAASKEGSMPAELREWIESWAEQRGEREGALIDLIASDPECGEKHFYLREVAHRARMDYLTQIPQHIPRFIAESIEAYNDRAERVTSVLDEILHHHPAPPQMSSS